MSSKLKKGKESRHKNISGEGRGKVVKRGEGGTGDHGDATLPCSRADKRPNFMGILSRKKRGWCRGNREATEGREPCKKRVEESGRHLT